MTLFNLFWLVMSATLIRSVTYIKNVLTRMEKNSNCHLIITANHMVFYTRKGDLILEK